MQNLLRNPVILLLALLAGCSADSMGATTDVIFHVNSFRVPCKGVAPMSCLQVKRGDPPGGKWQNFYSQIRGFEYRPGNTYRLLVRETRLPPDQVPADASSIRYDLVEIIEQSPDPRLAIQDIWVVERIEGVGLATFDQASRVEWPYLEFSIPRGEYLGNDGCSGIRGDVLAVDSGTLQLGPATKTDAREPCGDGLLQSTILTALPRVAGWRRDGLSLTLLDSDGVELFALRKVD